MTLWARFVAWIGKWAALAGGVVVALGAVAVVMFRKGEKTGAAAGAAEAAKARADAARQDAVRAESQQQAQHAAARAAKDVQNEIDRLPDAPPQQVGRAGPDTAAGKLQDWSRDQDRH